LAELERELEGRDRFGEVREVEEPNDRRQLRVRDRVRVGGRCARGHQGHQDLVDAGVVAILAPEIVRARLSAAHLHVVATRLVHQDALFELRGAK